MTFPRRTLLGAAGAAVSGLASPSPRSAASQPAEAGYPTRPVRIVVGFAAGGGNDLTARTLAPRLSALLGQAVVVDNRPGASGNVATEHVVRAPPDGHTLLMGSISSIVVNPTLVSDLGFDPQTDLTPVSMAGDVTNVLVVPADRPWRSVAELIAAARRAPGTLTYSSSGVGGAAHLGGALLDHLAGTETIHVPYRGGGPAVTDLIGGKIDFSFATAPTVLPSVEAGRLRALAVPTARRVAVLPEVPTVAETVPGFVVANWYAVMGSKNLPRPIVERLNAAVRAALADPAVRDALRSHGVEPQASSPEELARFIREETAKWAPIVRAARATAN